MKASLRVTLLLSIVVCAAIRLCSEENLMQNASTLAKAPVASASPSWMNSSIAKLQTELIAKYGDQQRPRIERGLHQVSEFWRERRWR